MRLLIKGVQVKDMEIFKPSSLSVLAFFCGFVIPLALFGQDVPEEFRVSEPVVCKSVKGLRDFVRLDPPELTTFDKLNVYAEPSGFSTHMVDGQRKAKFVQNAKVRAKGTKKILFERRELYRFEPEVTTNREEFYLMASIGFKNFPPGDYTLELETIDQAAKPEQKKVQMIEFRIISPERDETETHSKLHSKAPTKHRRKPSPLVRDHAKVSDYKADGH